jgi:hypothetical protein
MATEVNVEEVAVVEKHMFRKIVMAVVLVGIVALVVNLILNRGDIGIGRRPKEGTATPEDPDEDR